VLTGDPATHTPAVTFSLVVVISRALRSGASMSHDAEAAQLARK